MPHAFTPIADLDLGHDPLGLRAEIRDGLVEGAFAIALQPIACAASGALKGYEVLARWDRGADETRPRPAVSPDIFIAEAEACGLIDKLGLVILAQALEAGTRLDWRGDFFLSVNVSPAQLEDAGFPGQVLALLGATGFPAHRLELEVTETLPVSRRGLVALRALRAMGIAIALDDFGAGHADIDALGRLCGAGVLDKLKLDRSLVTPLDSPDASVAAAARAAVSAILGAASERARDRGLKITAEGVETEAQAASLRAAGVHLFQGWLIGKPQRAIQLLSAQAA